MTTRSDKKGLAPGTLVHVGESNSSPVVIRVMDYDLADCREIKAPELEALEKFMNKGTVSWIDVDGIHDAKVIAEIGKIFSIHGLVLEDIMNTFSRPKVEFYDDFFFLTLKMVELMPNKDLNIEQFSLIVGEGFVITFQERPGDNFDPVRERIRTHKAKVRSKDSSYLAYMLLDNIIDNYIAVSDEYSDRIENLEGMVLRRPTEFSLQRILNLRKELLDFKRSVDPLKEAINAIQREVEPAIAKYYRDLHDHIIYESENLSVYREMLTNLLELYHASMSYKTNNVLKVFAIITTIFAPLTFIVGVYGMNFDNMPELRWKYGYFYVLGFMLIVVAFLMYYFKRKRWL